MDFRAIPLFPSSGPATGGGNGWHRKTQFRPVLECLRLNYSRAAKVVREGYRLIAEEAAQASSGK